MYLMSLDSVRSQNTNNLVMAETALMRAALMGNPAVLTPNQAMDSLSLQEIILANNQSVDKKNTFCDAVNSGIVKVAIPGEKQDLIDCCLSALSRGIERPETEFIISGLKFLYVKDDKGSDVYPYETRCEVIRYIMSSLQNRKRKISVSKPEWLTPDQCELIDMYIESIILLDKAIDQYETEYIKKSQFPFVLSKQLANRLVNEDPKSETAFLINRLIKECSIDNPKIHRSYYYRCVDDFIREGYTYEVCNELRSIIDVAYNMIMAYSVNSPCELSLSSEQADLSQSIIDSSSSDFSLQTSFEKSTDSDALDWETINTIIAEVNRIMLERKCDWNEALNEYYVKESRVSGLITIKYASFTFLKAAVSSLVPGGFFVNFFQEIIEDVVGDKLSGKCSIPGSAKEIIARTKQSNKIRSVLDTVIHTNS